MKEYDKIIHRSLCLLNFFKHTLLSSWIKSFLAAVDLSFLGEAASFLGGANLVCKASSYNFVILLYSSILGITDQTSGRKTTVVSVRCGFVDVSCRL